MDSSVGGSLSLRGGTDRSDFQYPLEPGRPARRSAQRPGLVGCPRDRRPMKTGVTVPLLDLRAQYQPLREQILDAITRVCDSQRFILGAEVEALERELERAIGVAHAVAMSSGTDAILATLMALGI